MKGLTSDIISRLLHDTSLSIYNMSLYQGSVGSFAGSVLPFLFVWTVSRWNCCNWLFSRSALWSIFAWTVSMISIIINRHNHDHNCQHLMIIKLSRWKLFQNRSPLFQSPFEKSGGQTPKSKQKHCYKNCLFFQDVTHTCPNCRALVGKYRAKMWLFLLAIFVLLSSVISKKIYLVNLLSHS